MPTIEKMPFDDHFFWKGRMIIDTIAAGPKIVIHSNATRGIIPPKNIPTQYDGLTISPSIRIPRTAQQPGCVAAATTTPTPTKRPSESKSSIASCPFGLVTVKGIIAN